MENIFGNLVILFDLFICDKGPYATDTLHEQKTTKNAQAIKMNKLTMQIIKPHSTSILCK